MNKISDDKFNTKRKELLEKKDDNLYVSNIDLGFYDLTTYYNYDKDDNIIEKILFYENECRRIQHISEDTLFFMPEQEETLEYIDKYNRLIISAPTSFGKTLIVKEYIFRNKHKLKNIVYIVPTNALAYELESGFKSNKNFNRDYIIFDKNKMNIIDDTQERLLFIGTQEKFIEISDSFNHIDLFVIDEAYKLQDSTKTQRGFKLSETFLQSINSKSSKIVLLTPNAELIGFDKYDFHNLITHFNAVDKTFHVINEESFNNVLYEKAKFSKTILFCDSPNDMVKIAEEAIIINKTNDEYVKSLEDEFHPDWSVIKLIKKGILTHHGLMPKYVQNYMINQFVNNPNYNLLIGTNSISEGINTPTKNLFFYKDIDIMSKKNQTKYLLYKNTIGRAGRLGKYPIGHIFSTSNDLEKIDKKLIRIELAISNSDFLNEIEDSRNDLKLNALFASWKIFNRNCIDKIKAQRLSISKLGRTLKVLSTDLRYPGLANIPVIAQSVFKEDYAGYFVRLDCIYIRGCLQYSYKDGESTSKQLSTFSDKIDFFKLQYSKGNKKPLDNSSIIEGYMRFMYSTLEYYILPVMTIGKIIYDNELNWKFGNFVKETIKDFFDRYYTMFYGINIDDFTDNQKKIIETLKEYGVSLKGIGFNPDILKEIESELNTRYSTYDVVHAIKKLSKGESAFKDVYLYFLSKYLL